MSSSIQAWAWLFPMTYILHIAEETFAGEGFYLWIARVVKRTIPRSVFLRVNFTLLGLMLLAVIVMPHTPANTYLMPTLGTITFINGAGHIFGTLVTRKYSPGLVSGVLLWMPLGLITVVITSSQDDQKAWFGGIGIGLVLSLCITTLGFSLSRREPSS